MNKYLSYSTIFVTVLIVLSLFEILPILITVIFPELCYGCTPIGKFHQYLNVNVKFAYINWFAYTVLVLYLSYVFGKKLTFLPQLIIGLLVVCMLLLPVMPVINIITFILSIWYSNPPFIKNVHQTFPQSSKIESSYNDIKREYDDFSQTEQADCILKSNPGFSIENTSSDTSCWRGLFLKRAGNVDETQYQFFPKTIDCIRDDQIHNAFFSILDPGVEIPGHTGYYKGYLRYHLGVDIPNNESSNTDLKSYIMCGGEKYIWKNGEGVVFDDMYYHYVKNPTNQTRVVLYLDIKRNPDNMIIDYINHAGMWLVENSVFLKYFIKNQHNQIKLQT